MRTKDQMMMIQLGEMDRLNRRHTTYLLANYRDLNVAVIEGQGQCIRDLVETIRRTIREVPDGA